MENILNEFLRGYCESNHTKLFTENLEDSIRKIKWKLMELYVRVEWPECQYYMDCKSAVHIENSQDLFIGREEYEIINRTLSEELNK